MQNIHFDCAKCGQTIDAPAEMAAQLTECASCKATIEVPIRSQPTSIWRTEPATPPAATPPVAPLPVPTPSAPLPSAPPTESSMQTEGSAVASAFTVIGVLGLLGAIIGAAVVAGDSQFTALIVFVSGLISGMIFLGFARIIENTNQSVQHLRRIEQLLQKNFEEADSSSVYSSTGKQPPVCEQL